MICEWKKRRGKLHCVNCNQPPVNSTNLQYRRMCGITPTAAAKWQSKSKPCTTIRIVQTAKTIARFTIAAMRHLLNGAPTCTQEQIDERLAACSACPFFVNRRCELCGCCADGEKKFLNKLAWADQQCPDDPPRWLAAV